MKGIYITGKEKYEIMYLLKKVFDNVNQETQTVMKTFISQFEIETFRLTKLKKLNENLERLT